MHLRERVFSASEYETMFGFCRAVRTGDVIHVAGTAPIGEDGNTVAPHDAAAQARCCFDIVLAALNRLGATASDVVRTRMYLTHLEDWQVVGTVHGEFFGEDPPVSTLVGVAGLIDPTWRIEVEAEAIVEP